MKRPTIRNLAKEAGVNLEDALFLLRAADIDCRDDRRSLNKSALKRARAALGLPSREDLISPQYWKLLLEISEEDLEQLLKTLGIRGYRSGKRLPSTAVRRLNAEVARRNKHVRQPRRPTSRSTKRQEREHETPKQPTKKPARKRQRRTDHFVFRPPNGTKRSNVHWLRQEDVIAIHEELARDSKEANDPISPAGVRDHHLLESACFHPQTASFDSLKYPTVESAAAALLYALVKNHAFHNGNKRTALVSMLAFLDENGMYPQCSKDDLFEITLATAESKVAKDNPSRNADREVHAIALWIGEKFRLRELGDRPLQWGKLKRILSGYRCRFDSLPGNRLNIYREVERRRIFGAATRLELHSQVSCKNDGTDADLSTIKKIRADLELDDKSGIDSREFYSKSKWEPSDFIRRYRKILRRLARY